MTRRLFILTQYFPPETGAPQTRLSELSLGLQSRGWDIEVITALPNYPHGRIFDNYRGKWKSSEKWGEIPVHRYWLYASNSHKAFPRILSMLSFSLAALCILPKLWRKKPDYLLVESPPLTLGFTGWLLCLLSKPRFVFNVSDLWPLTAKALGAISDGWFYRFLESLEAFLYRRAFACTGQSEEIVAHIKQRGGKRVLLFRNGVDLSRFSQKTNHSGDENLGSSRKHRLVYTGLLGVAQGIVKICQKVDFQKLGAEFHIYGAGPEREYLESFLRQNPHHGIYFHGAVKSSEIPQILQMHDGALISLTRHIQGAVPSKIYESMAAGLPIFFSGSGEGAQIIEKHQLGWTNAPDDYHQLFRNIEQFSRNPDDRMRYSQNSREIAAQYFSRHAQIENLDIFLKTHLETGEAKRT